MLYGSVGRVGLRSSIAPFSPAALFAQGEQGGWYDPSDFTTLFQDAAGTTPVTAVEQPVGLVLDKRSAAFSQSFNGTSNNITIGSMPDALKLGTGDFTIEFFVKTNGTSVYSICGNLNDDSGSGHYWVILNSSYTGLHTVQFSAASTLYKFGTSALSTGAWHHIAITRSGSNLRCFLNGSQLGATGAISDFTGTYNNFVIGSNTTGAGNRYWLNGNLSNLRIVKGSALYTSSFSVPASALTAVSGTVLLCCGNNTFSSNPSLSYNGVVANGSSPFSAIDGSHLSQSTSTARPVLSARVNLLTRTETLTNSVWQKDFVTVTAGNLVYPSSGGSDRYVWYSLPGQATGVTYRTVLRVKNGGKNFAYIYNVRANSLFYVNLTTGVTSNVGTNIANLSTSVATDGWVDVSFDSVLIDAQTTAYVFVGVADAAGSTAVTVNGTDGIYVNKVDLRPANAGVGLPAYQRVGAATYGVTNPTPASGNPDYDTTGFPLYLKFDGTDDFLVSGTISPGSVDKAQVFAGVRKLSDAADRGLLDYGPNWVGSSGSFGLYAPSYRTGGLPAPKYYTALKGSTGVREEEFATYTAPITNVLAMAYDIGAASASEVVARINGGAVSASSAGGDAGGGNFSSLALQVGRYSASPSFNGHLYSLILRFSATNMDAATIASTETWVNSKTGAY